MHAESLQSCLTLCDPMHCSPPSSLLEGEKSFTFYFFKYLFIWLHQVSVKAPGICLASCGIFRCDIGTLEFWHVGSRACGLSSCGVPASLFCGILVPQSGVELASLVLQGRFLTTESPEKSLEWYFKILLFPTICQDSVFIPSI